MTQKFSWMYAFFGTLVQASTTTWHRRLVVRGVEQFPEGPVMLISNHQNGMEDPLACCVTAPRQCHFLTRADIFAKPSVDKLLRSMNMIPVYRPRDRRADARDRNEDSFARARARLANGCIIALFPEGNHGNRYHLRKFKTGMARIGLQALQEWAEDPNMPDNIQVVPVGLDYSSFTEFRSELLLSYGAPFSLNAFLEIYRRDQQAGVHAATAEARKNLLPRMLHVENLDRHDALLAIRPVWRHLHFGKHAYNADLEQNLHEFQAASQRLEGIDDAAFAELEAQFQDYQAASEALGIAPHEADLASRTSAWKLRTALLLLLGLPLFLFGVIAGLPVWALTRFVVQNKVRDPHFKSSFGIAVPVVVGPLWMLILAAIVVASVGWLWMPAVLIAAAGCGILALPYRDRFLRWKRALKLARASRQHQTAFTRAENALQALRSRLVAA